MINNTEFDKIDTLYLKIRVQNNYNLQFIYNYQNICIYNSNMYTIITKLGIQPLDFSQAPILHHIINNYLNVFNQRN